jgi:hypothetical protein
MRRLAVSRTLSFNSIKGEVKVPATKLLRKQTLIRIALISAVFLLTASVSRIRPEPTYLGNLAQYLLAAILTVYFLTVLAYGRDIMDTIASFLLRHRSQHPTQGGTWATVLGYFLLIGSMILIVRSGALQKIILALQQSATFLRSSSFGSLTGQAHSSSLNPSSFNPALYYYTVLLFLAIVAASFALFFGGLRTAYTWARDDLRSAKSRPVRQEALEIVRNASDSLRSNGEYRAVILRCYRQMCQMLSEDGFKIRLDETAREFSQNVSGKLKLGSEAVRGLTFLFEEARYSAHQIEDEKRVTALNELDILERALTGADS